MINLGIIGPGRVAERHATAITKSECFQLWSVCARDMTHAKDFSKRHNAQAKIDAFDDVSQMLSNPKLDAVCGETLIYT